MVLLTSWDMDLEFNEIGKRYGFSEERDLVEDSMKTTCWGTQKTCYLQNESCCVIAKPLQDRAC
jgi:hypothetical protein